MAINSERDGLQSNSEVRDYYFQAWDILGRLDDEVETLLDQMEKTSATMSTSTSALWSRIKELERVWIEIEARFDRFQGLPSHGGLQFYYAQLQCQYLVVHTNAKDAFNDAKAADKVEKKNSGKEPSDEEEQAKEAALKNEAIYQQKITSWMQTV